MVEFSASAYMTDTQLSRLKRIPQLWIDEQEIVQLTGVQPYHRLVCDALGLDASWYAVPLAQKNGRDIQTP